MTFYWTEQQQSVENKPQHPSKTRADWKSDDKCFKVWKRELKDAGKPKAEQYETFEVPAEIIVIAEWWSVEGYINSLGTWIRSNEIFSFGEPFVVRKNDWTVWLTWDWNTIWDKVKNAGWKLIRNIHFATKDSLDLSTLRMGWAWSGAWREAISNGTLTPGTHTVKLKEVGEWKKGKIEWSFPVFENANPLSDGDKTVQKAFAQELYKYGQEREKSVKEEVKENTISDDSLPF